MAQLLGHHVFSTRPVAARGQRPTAPLAPAEVLALILSALQWRKLCGPMRLYADAPFAGFIRERGLEWLYDNGIDTKLLATMPQSVDDSVFWAAAKVYAYSQTPAPAAFIDLDAILWAPLPDWAGCDLVFLHPERVNRGDPARFTTPPGYELPAYPWDGEEFNTALVVFNNEALRKAYTQEAIKFMEGNPIKDDPWQHLCFAEQGLLAQCAKAKRMRYRSVLSGPPTDEKVVTHLWGAKQKFRDNPTRAKAWVNRAIARIESDFPARLGQLRPVIDWARSTLDQQTKAAAVSSNVQGPHGPELLRRPMQLPFHPPTRQRHAMV